MLALLLKLAQEILDNQNQDNITTKKWVVENKVRVLSIIEELLSEYHIFPGIVIDILRELQAKDYDLCLLLAILKSYYPELASYQSSIDEIQNILRLTRSLKKVEKLTNISIPMSVIRKIFYLFENYSCTNTSRSRDISVSSNSIDT